MSSKESKYSNGNMWTVGNLPFVFRYGETSSNNDFGLPDLLTFSLEVDAETGVVRQTFDEQVKSILEKAYEHGSILSGAMDGSGIGQVYAQDFLQYITSKIPVIEGKRVLEIGSGNGYLLSLLRDLGADVVGIEPGAHGFDSAGDLGVKVVKDFFPSSRVSGIFDIVIGYTVLEHVPDLVNFFGEIRKVLVPQGQLILAVPNCRPYLEAGDLSCLFHEHWWYFTNDSLMSILRQQGFFAEVTRAGFGGNLYCSAGLFSYEGERSQHTYGKSFLDNYRARSHKMLEKFAIALEQANRNGESVGIYVPGRVINALTLLVNNVAVNGLRFFDDNEVLHGKYLPGFSVPIENWADFVDDPPDITVVASTTFGDIICERIANTSKSQTVKWENLF